MVFAIPDQSLNTVHIKLDLIIQLFLQLSFLLQQVQHP